MSTATETRPRMKSGHPSQPWGWRLTSYLFLVALIVLAAHAQQQPSEILIHPTGPLPAINIP